MLHRIAPLAFAAFLLSAVSASAQIDVSSLAIGAGSFSVRTDAFHSRSLHPDIEIGGRFLLSRMQWGLSWSWWNDQTLTPPPATDRLSWDAHRSHVFGARFAFRPFGAWNGPFALGLVAGASRHILAAERIDEAVLETGSAKPSRRLGTTLDFGARLDLRFARPLGLRVQALHHTPFDSGDSPLGTRWTYAASIVLSR